MRLDGELAGVGSCPHCGKANPVLVQKWHSGEQTQRADKGPRSRWAIYVCTSCGHVVSAKGDPGATVHNAPVVEIFPAPRVAHSDIPAAARTFLQQAYETLSAPDAAGLMAGSAVDAMLKDLGYEKGSLYVRIDQALEDRILTQGMADWAHSVRLGANRPRHADKDRPNLSAEEAMQSVEFAEALGNFLFVLTAKIQKSVQSVGGTNA